MNTSFRCLESRIDKNNMLYGKFSLNSIPSGQGNTFANSLRRSLFSDLSGLAITHFCITSKPGLGYEFATLPGLAESILDFSLNLKKIVLTGRVIDHEMQKITTLSSNLNSVSSDDIVVNPYVSSSKVGFAFYGRRTSSESLKSFESSESFESVGFTGFKGFKGFKGSKKISYKKKQSVENEVNQGFKEQNQRQQSQQKVSSALPIAPIGFLKAKGPAVLRAKDLILPPGIRCVHPNQYLGTLAADGALSIKFLIASGKGFIVQDEILYNSLSRAKLLLSTNGTETHNLGLDVQTDQYSGAKTNHGTAGSKASVTTNHNLVTAQNLWIQRKQSIGNVSSKQSMHAQSQQQLETNQRKRALFTYFNDNKNFAKNSLPYSLVTGFCTQNKKRGISTLRASQQANKFTMAGNCYRSMLLKLGIRSKINSEQKNRFLNFIVNPVNLLNLDNSLIQLHPNENKHRAAPCLASLRSNQRFVTQQRPQISNIESLRIFESLSTSLLRLKKQIEGSLLAEILRTKDSKNHFLSDLTWSKITPKESKILLSGESLIHFPVQVGKLKIQSHMKGCVYLKQAKDSIKPFRTSGSKASKACMGRNKLNQTKQSNLINVTFDKQKIRENAQSFLPYVGFTKSVNSSKKLSKKQLIWGTEKNFYPVLPLDVTFTPVSKVNFQINVDRNSEKNKEIITFEIWTNGSITPKRAIQESCLYLAQDFYNLFCHVNEFSGLQFWWKRESIESKITRAPTFRPNALKKQLYFAVNSVNPTNSNYLKHLKSLKDQQEGYALQSKARLSRKIIQTTTPYGAKNLDITVSKNKNQTSHKKMHSQVKNSTKLKFPESKNLRLKHKVQYLHAFWRLNVSDLNFSLTTQLVLKKLNINSVYDLHFFILRKSWSLFLNRQQQKEIIKIYLNFGLNSPF